MQKKVIIAIILLCVVGIIVFLTTFMMKIKVVPNNTYKVVPNDVAVVVDFPQISDASKICLSEKHIVECVAQFPVFKKSKWLVTKLDSVIQSNPQYEPISSCQLLCVTKKIGVNKLDYLFVISLGKEQFSMVKEILESAYNVSDPEITNFDKKAAIYTYQEQTSERGTISIAEYENNVLISESRVFIESAMKCHSDGNLYDDESFKRIESKNSKDVKFYMHLDRTADIFQQIASSELVESHRKFPNKASWCGLDLDMSKKAKSSFHLVGYITTDSLSMGGEYFDLFKEQQSLRGDIVSVLPSSTNYFVAFALSDVQTFKKQYEKYLIKNSYFNSYQKNVSSLNKNLPSKKGDAANLLYSWLDNEFALVMTPSSTNDLYENVYGVLKINAPKQVEAEWKEMVQASSNSSINMMPYGDYTIYESPVLKIPQILFGDVFSKLSAKYVAFVDSYMVFANSDLSLKTFLSDKEKGKLLTSNPNYGRFDDNVKRSYSMYAYVSVPHSLELIKNLFEEKTWSTVTPYLDDLKNMNAVSYQIVADNAKVLYNDIYVSLESIKQDTPEIEWKSSMDSSIVGKPTMFISHKDESLTLIQDASNTLLLIDNETGRCLWGQGVELDGPIMGDIHFVDVLNNKKIQYLFNTEHTIYLIDRNGNKVGNFPISLSSVATAPIAVFDYDNLKKYRIAVPCSDLSIKLFSLEDGLWNSINWQATSERVVSMPLQHFVDDGKDYIVYADQYHIYIVNRRGDIRIPVDEVIEKAPNAKIEFEFGADSTLSKFITTDVDGKIKEIYTDGTVQTSSACGSHSENHYFMKADFDADGNGDYLFVDDNKIEVYSQNFKRLFSYSANCNLKNPFVKPMMKGIGIGVMSDDDKKIFFFNSEGTLYKGFPLDASSNFDFTLNRKNQKDIELIVGGENNLLYYYSMRN